MEKYLYTIGEVAQLLGENVDLVRNWTKVLGPMVKCERNSHGARLYKKEDIELLRDMHYLVRDKRMTLDGARRQLAGSRAAVRSRVKIIESLTDIRARLLELREVLD